MTVLRMQIVPILYRELVFSKAKGDRRIFHLASSPYPSHLATTALAKQLPRTLIEVRAMSSTASTPSRTAMPSIGRWNVARVPVRMTMARRSDFGRCTCSAGVSDE